MLSHKRKQKAFKITSDVTANCYTTVEATEAIVIHTPAPKLVIYRGRKSTLYKGNKWGFNFGTGLGARMGMCRDAYTGTYVVLQQ